MSSRVKPNKRESIIVVEIESQTLLRDGLFSVPFFVLSLVLIAKLGKIVALSPRAALTVAVTCFIFGLTVWSPLSPVYQGPGDGEGYLLWGNAIAEAWLGQNAFPETAFWPGKGVWPAVLAMPTYFLGELFHFGIVLNSVIAGFTILVLQRATFLAFGFVPQNSIVFFSLLNVAFLIHAGSLLREALVWFGIASGVLALAEFSKGKWAFGWPWLVLSVVTVLALRPNYGSIIAYILLGLGSLMWFAKSAQQFWIRVSGFFLAALLLVVSFPAVFGFLSGVQDVRAATTTTANALKDWGEIESAYSPLGSASDEESPSGSSTPSGGEIESAYSPLGSASDEESPSGSSTPSGGESSKLIDTFCGVSRVLCDSISRLPNLLFGPFLWELRDSPVWVASLLSTWFFSLISGLALISLFRDRNVYSALMLIGASLILVSLASVLTNYGIIMRMRVMAEIFLIPPALAGARELKEPVARAVGASLAFVKQRLPGSALGKAKR